MAFKDILYSIPRLGEYLSIAVKKSISYISSWGLIITELQTKLILLILLGAILYLILKVISFTKKILKIALIFLTALLLISILTSIFI